MTKTRREVIIEDITTGAKSPGIIKKAGWKAVGVYSHQFFLISNMFNGSRCFTEDKENFRYSWILTEEPEEKINKIDLRKMKSFEQKDWNYNLPDSVIGTSRLDGRKIYKIYFKKADNFKEIII